MAREDDFQITDEELLPDGEALAPDGDGYEFDIENLHVNFSEKEAASEARDYTPLPTGKYHCSVTDIEIARSTSKKNAGKPYYKMELTVQDGPYVSRKLWANVMLFEGALYTIAQIIKAMDRPMNGKVPTPNELMGYDFVVSVAKVIDTWKINKQKEEGTFDPNEPKPYKNEVKGFIRYTKVDGGTNTVSSADSLLP